MGGGNKGGLNFAGEVVPGGGNRAALVGDGDADAAVGGGGMAKIGVALIGLPKAHFDSPRDYSSRASYAQPNERDWFIKSSNSD